MAVKEDFFYGILGLHVKTTHLFHCMTDKTAHIDQRDNFPLIVYYLVQRCAQ